MVVTYRCFNLRCWDNDHCPQNELAILGFFKKVKAKYRENPHKTGKKVVLFNG